jgi:ATP-dependent RNA helicase RhlE
VISYRPRRNRRPFVPSNSQAAEQAPREEAAPREQAAPRQAAPRHAAPRHAAPRQAAPRREEAPREQVAARPPAPRAVAPASDTTFAELGLVEPILRAVAAEGYTHPTPIQAAVIEHGLAGRDVIACAQTGTGKTAAFVLPVLQRLSAAPRTRRIRTLVVTPTRELAAQIAERAGAYGRHLAVRLAVIYGGVGQRKQEDALDREPDLLIATPGRLLDLMQQGIVELDGVGCLVLDEADRMLDMGFIRDVRRICEALPKARQTLLFSATMPPEIEKLARTMLVEPVRVHVAPAVTTAETVEQSVLFVERSQKRAMLERVLRQSAVERALVFTRTKHGANRLTRQLTSAGIGADVIHGNKSQGARERALAAFRDGSVRVLVATDLAARGIDVEGISHVINFELPNEVESYVHRIGRTGRAGASGRAISFCDGEERGLLADIERFIRRRLPVGSMVPS